MQYFYLYTLLILYTTGDVFSEVKLNPNWVAEIKGDESSARKVAEDCGFEYIGKIGNLPGIYHFRESSLSLNRTKRSAIENTKLLTDNPMISWVEQQKYLIRVKRSIVPTQNVLHNNKSPKNMFNDPKWPKEWYLYDSRISRSIVKLDLHVIPVWDMNITGRGVKVTVIDDGIDHNHPDLRKNYNSWASTDLVDGDSDPMPIHSHKINHGTVCATEIAMVANNNICGVGVAYNAWIGGIRLLGQTIDDHLEYRALGFRNDYIDIYSSSWGPRDNGKSMEKPGRLALRALIKGVTEGRKGKGNLYVWATGNGGVDDDNCGLDGYVSSMYVIPISSISPNGTTLDFSERCSSIMASTLSSSYHYNLNMVGADINGGCTERHTGTSSSASLAAGVFALALEANPSLTWRDVKHLLAWTSQVLITTLRWKRNHAGFFVNPYFGFGQIDAANFVKTAIFWVTVPPMVSCTLTKNRRFSISSIQSSRVRFNGTQCYPSVKFIENIVIKITFQYSKRGALQIALRSPKKMKTILMYKRRLDESVDEMVDWPFNTVHNWGEDPRGTWRVAFRDKREDYTFGSGYVKNVSITFYGTKTMPEHMKKSINNRRTYNANYNQAGND